MRGQHHYTRREEGSHSTHVGHALHYTRTHGHGLRMMQHYMEPPGVRFCLSKEGLDLTAHAHNFFYPYRPTQFQRHPGCAFAGISSGICGSTQGVSIYAYRHYENDCADTRTIVTAALRDLALHPFRNSFRSIDQGSK